MFLKAEAAGEQERTVAQLGHLVCVCFPTEVAFMRNACWLLCRVITCKILTFGQTVFNVSIHY